MVDLPEGEEDTPSDGKQKPPGGYSQSPGSKLSADKKWSLKVGTIPKDFTRNNAVVMAITLIS